MNKKILFIILCLVLCLIPSVGMIFFPTTESTENKKMAELPEIKCDDDSYNKLYFQQLGEYFEEHIALRNQLIYTDAKIQTKIFKESNIASVLYGKKDWLYYSSTLDDYTGRAEMSDRDLYNLAHNISVVRDYLDEREIKFSFTVPPNKNTLYNENMPNNYISQKDKAHNAELLKPYLVEKGINYTDLFDLFKNNDETLYLKRDSHWNTKGACLAYSSIMESLDREFKDYRNVSPSVTNDTNGDLNKMLYSFYGETEKNYSYNLPNNYSIVNDASGVDAGWIVTENALGNGTVLMFRDSFADSLIPFISNEFETSYYSKAQPNALERYIENDKPECVIIEKVERNISDYLETPPILTPSAVDTPNNTRIIEKPTDVEIKECMFDTNYITITGTINEKYIDCNSDILICVDGTAYPAYHTTQNGFILYLKKSVITDGSADICIYSVSDNEVFQTSVLHIDNIY